MTDKTQSTTRTHRDYGSPADHPEDFHATAGELQLFDPDLVLGYYRRLETILHACPIDIYAASSLKHPWPYRLQNAAECYPASFWRSQHRILDSAITSPELSNQDVLDHAVERHATAVVAKDYMPFDIYREKFDRDKNPEKLEAVDNLESRHGDNVEATTESIRDFASRYDAERHPPAYIPLQAPYDDHVQTVWSIVENSDLEHRYMLGGLKDATPSRRVDELLAFRSEVGDGPVAHGLGWGLSDDLVATLRDEPDLLDSVDNSGPAQAIQNDKVLDKHWRANDCAQVDGDYQNSIGGAFEFAMLLQGAQRLTEFNDDFDDVPVQSGLGDFNGVVADG